LDLYARIRGNKMSSTNLNNTTKTEIEAAAFRRLIAHLDERKDVQNIDMMILAGFCRNCLSKWYKAAADEKEIDLSYEEARTEVYGMTYDAWKDQYQAEATPEQLAALEKANS